MSAYQSRGAGVLMKLRVEHRLSLSELAYALFASHEDIEDEEEFTVQDVRHAVVEVLRQNGTEAIVSASDRITSEDDAEDSAERLACSRRLIAKAYRRDFAKFPETLAAFERGESE